MGLNILRHLVWNEVLKKGFQWILHNFISFVSSNDFVNAASSKSIKGIKTINTYIIMY